MLAALLPVAVVALAQAELATATLEYLREPGAEVCPDEAQLRAEVAARLGHDPFREEAEVHVLARLYRNDALRARIEMHRGSEPVRAREIHSDGSDCADLFDSVVLAISLSVDPLVLARTRRPTLMVPVPMPQVGPEPEPPRRAIFEVAFGGASTFGVLPGVTWGPAFGGRISGERFSAEMHALISVQGTWRVGPASVDGSMALATLAGCAHEGLVAGCALAAGGALEWLGRGVEANLRTIQPWAALGARAQFEWPRASPWAMRLHAQILLPLTRAVLVGDGREIWTAPAWALGGGAMVVRRFR